jgi:CHAT domain-containing protein/HEAT repeat protein
MVEDILAPFIPRGETSEVPGQLRGCPVLSPRNPRVAYSASEEGVERLYVSDYESGEVVCVQDSSALPMAFAPDDGRLIAAGTESLWLFQEPWDTPVGIELLGVRQCAWVSGQEILVVTNDQNVSLVSLDDREVRPVDVAGRWPSLAAEVVSVTCSRSGAVAVLEKEIRGEVDRSEPRWWERASVSRHQLRLFPRWDTSRPIVSSPFDAWLCQRLILGEDGLNILVEVALGGARRFRVGLEKGGALEPAGTVHSRLFKDFALGTETLLASEILGTNKLNVFRLGDDLEPLFSGSVPGEGSLSNLVEAEGAARFAIHDKNTVRVFELNDADLVNLASEDTSRVLRAIRSVGRRRLSRARTPLERFLRHDEQEVRSEAVEALGQIAAPESAPPLIALLGLREPTIDPAVTMAALARFGRIQLAESLPKALRGRAPDRRGAVRYLTGRCETRFPEALSGLQECLTNPALDAETRWSAAKALGPMADLRAALPLLRALGDKVQEVREAAGGSLKETLRRNGLLCEELAAQLTQPIDLFDFAKKVIQGNRIPDPVGSSHPVGSFLSTLSASIIEAAPSLDELRNTVESLTTPRDDLPSRAAKGLGLVVALVFAEQFRSRGQWASALETFTHAASLAEEAQVPDLLWRCQKAVAECHQSQGQDRNAAQAFGSAMETIDKLWFALIEDETLEQRTLSFFADKADLYEQAALCNLRLGHAALSLECLEKAKTRYLGDLIARRQKKKRQELAREMSGVWQLVDYQFPRQLAVSESREVGEHIVITGVTKAEAVEEQLAARPERLCRLDEEIGPDAGRVDGLWAIEHMWNLAAHIIHQEVLPEEMEPLSDLYESLRAVRSASRSGEWPLPESDIEAWSDRFREAVRLLLPQGPAYGFLSDFAPTIEAWAYGKVESDRWRLLMEAVVEALDLALDRPVEGRLVFDDLDRPHAVRRVRFDHAAIASEQSDLSVRARTVNRAFERLSSGKWRYVTRAARGVTATFGRSVELLLKTPRTAQVQFGATQKGTIAYIAFSDTNDRSSSASPSSPADHLEVIQIPALTLDALHDRLIRDPNGWFPRYRDAMYRKGRAEQWFGAMNSTLAWLSEALWSPIHELLLSRDVERVRIVPHRILQLVPFAALPTGRRLGRVRRLIDSFELHFAPSFTLYDLCTERAASAPSRPRRFTAICDPEGNLPLAIVGVLDHVRRLPTASATVLTRDEATLRRLRDLELGQFLHFGGHAAYDWDEPLDSHLNFHEGKKLTLEELFEGSFLVQGLELVTLSACETSLVRPDDPADEWLGLASGFLFGGTRSVLSTLWRVDSLATSLLLSKFYRLHIAEGMRADRALRDAQRWLRDRAGRRDVMSAIDAAIADLVSARDEALHDRSNVFDELIEGLRRARAARSALPKSFAHPYYWAGFTVSGNVERVASGAV